MPTTRLRGLARLAALSTALVVAVPLMGATAPVSAGEPSGPVLTVPLEQLQAAVECDDSVRPGAGTKAVLLVHGTAGEPETYWGFNYARALPHYGYGVCTVTLPDRALRNVVVSAEYVVHAARYAHQRSGRKIALIGHSQGGSLAVWAAKFWPDVAAFSDDVIALSGGFGGTRLGNLACVLGSCPEIDWQVSVGSHVTRALMTSPYQPNGPDFTSVLTYLDDVVFPQPAGSTLPGATNIAVQSICPLHVADHVTMLVDPVGFALTLDALGHDGPADPARIRNRLALCTAPVMPYATLPELRVLETGYHFLAGALLAPHVRSEPLLPPYAYPYGGY